MNTSPFSTATAPDARRRLIEAAQHGDERAGQELVRRYEPLVQRVLRQLRVPSFVEREDLAQEARLGLLAAIRAWRPERGPFPAFADRCVSNAALLALIAACRHKQLILTLAVSLHAYLGNPAEDGTPVRLLDVLPAPADALTDPESRLLVGEELTSVLHALPTLTASEHTALAGTLSGRSYQQMAPAQFGTWKAAEHAAYRARRKLEAALAPAA